VSSRRLLHTFTFILVFSLSTYPVALSKHTVSNNEKKKSEQLYDPSLNSDNARLLVPEQPLISSSSPRLSVIDKTYLDAYTILRESNNCSHFFGGSYIAIVVLNRLYQSLRKTTLVENEIGIAMSGAITTGNDLQTGIGFRLFENVAVNMKGPFYQSFNPKTHKFFNKIGAYPANTREARVVMLLHELGHLLPGSGAHWLLLDDGGNFPQVIANTAMVMDKCNEQVKALSLQHPDISNDSTAQLNPHK